MMCESLSLQKISYLLFVLSVAEEVENKSTVRLESPQMLAFDTVPVEKFT